MKVLIAYDEFLSEDEFRRRLEAQMKDLVDEIEFSSYKVEAKDTPPNLPSCFDHLTWGNPEDLVRRIKGVDVLLVHKAPVTSDVFEKADKLKIIGCPRTSPGNIDIKTATTMRIPIVYAPGRNANAVAELTMGLIITEIRHICRGQNWLRDGKFVNKSPPTDLFTGNELREKTLGIVGLGQIGRIVARLAKAFGMNVLGYDPYVNAKELSDLGVQITEIETLLKNSNIVTLHVRLQEGQNFIIGKRELSLMKKNSYLINTSDGPVVDQEALCEALKRHEIAGAAQDTWVKKPVTLENPLLGLYNITVTPGLGGATHEVPGIGIQMVVEDIARFYRGEKPRNTKNPDVLSDAWDKM